jgi:hypothetical protein
MTSQEGRCLCGGIVYAASAPPVRVTICYCRFCQVATGGPVMVEPIFAEGTIAFTQGEPATFDLSSWGSGKRITAHFCATCGTKLWLTFERWTGVVGVYGGTFDDPNWFDRWGDNSKCIFMDAAQDGTIVPPGVKAYPEHAQTNDGEPLEPVVFDAPHLIRRGPGEVGRG